jgi:ketosteroid isomerase-like protein
LRQLPAIANAAFAITLLAGSKALAQTPDAAPVIAAERAFAADTAVLGINAGFTRWSVPDAVVIEGGQVSAVRAAYPDRPRAADEPALDWWPNWAGIAMSGDLGFTTGAVSVNGRRSGHYFTIWMKQADGVWRWVYDGGSGASAADAPDATTEPIILATARVRSSSPEAAMNEVKAAEVDLAAAARTDQAAAHLAVLADDGRLYVAPRPPAMNAGTFAEALAGWPKTFEFGPTEGGGASQAGDLVWTYGPAAWMRAGQPRHGHYVRLWQKRPAGWVLAFAQLVPVPAPPEPPAAPAPPARPATPVPPPAVP